MVEEFDFNEMGDEEMMGDVDMGEGEWKVGEEKEIGKTGLKKKLVKEGEGRENPGAGDDVEGIFLFIPTFSVCVWVFLTECVCVCVLFILIL